MARPRSRRTAPSVVAERVWVLLAMGARERFRSELEAAGPRGAEAMRIPKAAALLEQADSKGARRIAEETLEAHPADARALVVLARAASLRAGRPRLSGRCGDLRRAGCFWANCYRPPAKRPRP